MKTFLRIVVSLLLFAGCIEQAISGETVAGGPRITRKVLFVGDSITLHPPSEPLGWKGNWGMASSAAEKDYAHLFYAKICAAQPEPKPELVISGRDGAVAGRIDQNLANLDRLKAVGADLIVIQLGENEGAKDLATFEELYERLVVGLKGDQNSIILCTGVWSPSGKGGTKDDMIRRVCERHGTYFVPITPVPAGSAALFDKRYTNDGVNWHPGDKGMQHYADALWLVAAPLLGGQPSASPLRTGDGFEYETEEALKAVWKIEGTGFTGPIEVRLNTSEAREGKKCLELILPPVTEKGEGRVVLDAFPKFPLNKLKQIRFGLRVERKEDMIRRGIYFSSSDMCNFFVHYFSGQDAEEWERIYIPRQAFHGEMGHPSWDSVSKMRLSFWFQKGTPANRILLDEVVWDSKAERPMNKLNKDWYE
jgi:lysophospholipase L1-like esterase